MPPLRAQLRPETWRRHSDDIAKRARQPGLHAHVTCVVLGCGRPKLAAKGKGFGKHCEKHFDHFNAHGSYEHPTITSPILRPFRQHAERWLRRNAELAEVRAALVEVDSLLDTAGQRPLHPDEWRGMNASEKAWNILAHLRKKGVPAIRIVAIHMAVNMIIEHDHWTDRRTVYRRVQVSKVLHRRMPGRHVRNPATGDVMKSHHAPSRGVKLRHLGRIVARACGGLDGFLPAVFAEADKRAARNTEMAAALAVLRCGVTTVKRRDADGRERFATIRVHRDGSPMVVPVSPRKKARTKPWTKGDVGRAPRPKPEKPAPFNTKLPTRREQYWWEAHPPRPGTPAAAQMMREVEALGREAHARWLEAREAAKAEVGEGESG